MATQGWAQPGSNRAQCFNTETGEGFILVVCCQVHTWFHLRVQSTLSRHTLMRDAHVIDLHFMLRCHPVDFLFVGQGMSKGKGGEDVGGEGAV